MDKLGRVQGCLPQAPLPELASCGSQAAAAWLFSAQPASKACTSHISHVCIVGAIELEVTTIALCR